MASRPEAAYAATEVTPKWVLISWHHLLPSSLIIPAPRAETQLFASNLCQTRRQALAVLARGVATWASYADFSACTTLRNEP
jgi:hypothetical protein